MEKLKSLGVSSLPLSLSVFLLDLYLDPNSQMLYVMYIMC